MVDLVDSEPTPEKDESAAKTVSGPATLQTEQLGTNGRAEVKSGQEACSAEREKEVDDFGLPVKKIRRSLSSEVEREIASEDGGPKARDLTAEPTKVQEVRPAQTCANDRVEEATDRAPEESSTRTNPLNNDNAVQTTASQTTDSSHKTAVSEELALPAADDILHGNTGAVSGWSHQALAPQKVEAEGKKEEDAWQNMPAYAQYDLYDDDGHLVAREAPDSDDEANAYTGLGGAGKGYTRVQIDEDAKSATSMDENTDYLFKPKGDETVDDDDEQRDPLAQLQATKELLTEGQRIAYVGVTRLAMAQMVKELESIETTRSTKKGLGIAIESMKMWSQKMMVRLYMHMEINSSGEYIYYISQRLY